jgi:hypothetical protein
MGCASEINVCIIRGSFWPLTVTLSASWVEVAESPSNYRIRLVLRRSQDDSDPDLLMAIVAPELIQDAILNEPRVIASFGLAGTVTQTLPDYDIVGFCEIYDATTPLNPTRLFNMKVSISD